MGNATPATPLQGAGAAGAIVPQTPATPPQGAGATTGDASQQSSAAAAFDWSKADWESIPVDKIPWDKIGSKVPLDKLEPARQMQSSLRKQVADEQAQRERLQADLAAHRKRLEQVMGLVKAQGPQYEQQIQSIEAQAQTAQLQAELESYRQREAIQAMADDFGVPLDVIQQAGGASNAYAVMRAVTDFHRSAGQTGNAEMMQELVSLKAQLQALRTQQADPVAQVDGGTATSSNLQTLYNEAAKKGDGPGAEKIRRQAEAAGIELDTVAVWQDTWRNRR